jgi:uncharacterized delta-60 repeat protein
MGTEEGTMARVPKRLIEAAAHGVVALSLVACGAIPRPGASAGPIPTLDGTFGAGGVATLPLNATTHDRFMAVAVAPDGKVYAAGYVIEGGDQIMAVARLDASGALDRAFGKEGMAAVNAAPGGKAGELARSIVVQSSGKIVIAGPAEHDVAATGDAARDTDVAVARFDATGKLDPTFGTGGVAKIDLGAGRITSGTTFVGDNAWGLGSLPDDRVVVFGSKLADGGGRTDSDYVVVGLTSAGALDAGFGNGGQVVVDLDRSGDSPRNLLVQADGKIVATGYSAGADGVVTPVLIRVTAAGVLDAPFGTNGVATTRILPGVAESYAVAAQGDGYISVGYGRGADAAEKVDVVVERYKSDGSLDRSFGKDGLTRVDVAKDDDRARNVAVLPDGRVLVVGSGKKTPLNVDAMMVLLDRDGAPVAGFGEKGNLISDLGGTADSWYGVALSPDQKYVYVAGYKGTEGSGNDDSVIARLKL